MVLIEEADIILIKYHTLLTQLIDSQTLNLRTNLPQPSHIHQRPLIQFHLKLKLPSHKNTHLYDFWSYALLGEKYTSNKVAQYKLDKMRESFLYWYPMDLRCSAKDLNKKHLAKALPSSIMLLSGRMTNFGPKDTTATDISMCKG